MRVHLPKNGTQPPLPIFSPCLLWPSGWMDQDATWYGGMPRPRRHCVRWGPSSPKKRHTPQFFTHVCCGQTTGCDWMDQDATLYGARPRPRRHCARWGPFPPKKGRISHFSADVCFGQTAGWIKVPLGTKVDLGPGHIVLDGDPVLPRKKGYSPHFRPVYCGQTVAHLSYC